MFFSYQLRETRCNSNSGFWHSVKSAFGDGVDTALSIILGVIQFVIVLVPILLLIVLPLWLVFRFLRRRIDWPKRPASAATESL
jgi:hypothetical protein